MSHYRHKFFFHTCDLGDGAVAHESQLVCCWLMLVIGSLGAM